MHKISEKIEKYVAKFMNRVYYGNIIHEKGGIGMKQTVPVILASASPRRREILSMLGIDFRVEVSDVDETVNETEPGSIVETLAERKAEAVFARIDKEDAAVIGSDTIVWKDGKVLGKPADTADAWRMLTELSGAVNTVYTGVCIFLRINNTIVKERFHCAADVEFAQMSDEEVRWYAGTGEPMDKVGAYAVQGLGGRFIRGIRGDYYTVMGLPMNALYEKLVKTGVLLAETRS